MKTRKHHIWKLCLLFILASIGVLRAQQFPISINTILTTPALPYLEEFIRDNPASVMVNIVLNDATTNEFEIGLRLTISGQGVSIFSDPNYFGSSYTLTSNVPEILTGFDLAEYFNPDNLIFSGISKEDYLNNGRLPEGFYSICFEAYDLNNPNSLPVSNKGCGNGMIEQYDPPMLINPIGATIYSDVQNYIFQWQALHPGSLPVEYYLDIYERTEGLADVQIIENEAPYAQIFSENLTTYVYSLADPLLQNDTEYLMLLQVVDPSGQYIFKNNGYSAIEYFNLNDGCTFGDFCDDGNDCTENDRFNADCNCAGEEIPGCGIDEPCDIQSAPVVDNATEIEQARFIANWTSDTECFEYLILDIARDSFYTSELETFTIDDVNLNTFEITDISLDLGDYYYRIQGFSTNSSSAFSKSILVSLNKCRALSEEELEYACGILDSTLINDAPLMTKLEPGSKIYASDWLVEITEASGAGTFSGKAKFTNELFPQAQLNLIFQNIKVNENCQLVDGFLEVDGFGLALISPEISALLDQLIEGIDMALDALDAYEQIMNDINDILNQTEGINDYLTDDWNILDGTDPIITEYPYIDSTVIANIEDAMDCFLLGGNIDTCVQQLIDALQDLQDEIEDMYNADYQVLFKDGPESEYGYDKYKYQGTEEIYDQILIAEKAYDIPWISIQSGGFLNKKLYASSSGNVPSSTTTRIENNRPPIDVIGEVNDAFENEMISVLGKNHEEKHQVYAYQEFGDDSIKIAGKANVVSYDPIELKVQFVQVNSISIPNINWKDTLQKIYDPAIVELNLLDPIQINSPIDILQDTSGTAWYTNYTNEMKDIIDLIPNAGDDVHYILFVNDIVDPLKLGYMPRGKAFGFIFVDNHSGNENAIIKTVAHELAHGAYKLQHPTNVFPEWQGQNTDLLMDKNQEGTHLAFYDWDKIHNPDSDLGLFDEDEEGEHVTVEIVEMFVDYKNGEYLSFLNNKGMVINLMYDSIVDLTFATGGELYQSKNILIPVGSLLDFSLYVNGEIIEYTNCSNGSYYLKGSGCINQKFNNKIVDKPKPVILRAIFNGENLQLVHRMIPNYKEPDIGIVKYDYLLDYFFKLEMNTSVNIANITPMKLNSGYSLSSDFNDSLFLEFIEEFPEYLNVNKYSSFYINGYARVLNKYKEYYLNCDNEYYTTSALFYFLNLTSELIILPREDLLLNHKIPLEIDETPVITESLDEAINNMALGFSKMTGKLSGDEIVKTYQFYIDRNKLIKSTQEKINNFSQGTNYLDLFKLLKDNYLTFSQCEIDQLVLTNFNTIRDVIIFAIIENSFWLDNVEEYAINWLLDQVNSVNYIELLDWLESYNYEEKFYSIDSSPSTMSGGGFVLKDDFRTIYLWQRLIERVDNSWLDDEGTYLINKLIEIYREVITSENNEYSNRVDNLFETINGNIFGDNKDELSFYEVNNIPILPYNYKSFLARWKFNDSIIHTIIENPLYLNFPLMFLIEASEETTTDVTVNVNGTIDILQNYKHFFHVAGTDYENSRTNVRIFDPLILDRSSSFGISKQFLDEPDEVLNISPGILYYFLNEEAVDRTTSDLIITAIDIATLAIPVTKIKHFHKVLILADKASSLLSIAGTSTQDVNSTVSQYLNICSAVLGFGSMGAGLSAKKVNKLQEINSGALHAKHTIELVDEASTSISQSIRVEAINKLDIDILDATDDQLRSMSPNQLRGIQNVLENPEYATGKSGLSFEGSVGRIKTLLNIPVANKLDEIVKAGGELGERASHIQKLYLDGTINIRFVEGSNEIIDLRKLVGVPLEEHSLGKISLDELDYVKYDEVLGDELAHVGKDGKVSINCISGDCEIGFKCFPAGTRISLNNHKIPIESVKKGMKVTSFDHNSNLSVSKTVVKTFESTWNKMITLFFGKRRISCTPNHRFWIPSKNRYIPADSLIRGVKVLSLAVGLLSLDSVVYADTIYTAYNFEVEDNHNYFVGDDAILVHNDCRIPKANIEPDELKNLFPDLSPDELLDLRAKLAEDLLPNGSSSPPGPFFDYIKNAPTAVERGKRIRNWKVLYDAGRNTLKLDPIILAKIGKILDDPGIIDFVKTIKNPQSAVPKFSSPEEFLSAFAIKHTEAPGGQLSFGLELDNLDNFVVKYKSFDGAGEYLEEMTQTGSKFKGGSYGLDILKNNLLEITENNKYIIDGFEGGIDGIVTGHRLDIRLKNKIDETDFKYVETKHWSEARSVSGSTYDQFKAYVQSAKYFEYRFKNLSDEMKIKFQNLFKKSDKVDELWSLNSSFFTSKGFINQQEVIDAAMNENLITNSLLNFVKQ